MLLRLAAACGHQTAVMTHAHARLLDLAAQAHSLAYEAKAAAESSQVGVHFNVLLDRMYRVSISSYNRIFLHAEY